jgi:hypothetical protein
LARSRDLKRCVAVVHEGHVGGPKCTSNGCHPLVPRRPNRIKAKSASLHVSCGAIEVPAQYLRFEECNEFVGGELCIVERRCTDSRREVALSDSPQEVALDDFNSVHAAI